PSAAQSLPPHLAIWLTALPPPANPKLPPAYTSLPKTASAYTEPPVPKPRFDQLLPFHLAMKYIVLTPTFVKVPPAYRFVPDTASAYTLVPRKGSPPPIPAPSAHQLLPSHLAM